MALGACCDLYMVTLGLLDGCQVALKPAWTYVEQLGNGGAVCVEVALCPLGNALTAPRDEYRLGQTGVGVLQLGKGELDATVREVFEELMKLALCRLGVSLSLVACR